MEPSRRVLLAEAVASLAVAAVAVGVLPFRHGVKVGALKLGRRRADDWRECVWAVETAAAHTPWRTVCFQKGIALQRMLRRRGVDALLRYGVRFTEGGELQAHVWVDADGRTVIGGDEAPRFKVVATYPE